MYFSTTPVMSRARLVAFQITAALVTLILLFTLLSVVANAQSGLPPGALASTSCLGGHIQTAIDVRIIGTDSLEEILVHEAKHREQAMRTAPMCPKYDRPDQLLNDEVEAYCTSRPIRMQRGFTEQEVDANYLMRLIYQFKGALPRFTITDTYSRSCPPTLGE